MKKHSFILLLTGLLGCSTSTSSVNESSTTQNNKTAVESVTISDTLANLTFSDSIQVKLHDQIAVLQSEYSDALSIKDTVSAIAGLEALIDVLNEHSDSTAADFKSNQFLLSKSQELLKSLNPEENIEEQDSLLIPKENEIDDQAIDHSKIEFALRGLDITKTEIPLDINNLVEKNISYFQTKGQERMATYLERATTYFPIMFPIMQEEGVPKELIYLTMVESGVNPEAKSRAKAIGMWQFIRGTGRLYGLKGNFWFDERKNIEKSTRAAAKHFKDLYRDLGSWHLALAAYNSGQGRVKRAIRRAKGNRDFWAIRKYLPRETRNYVPAFIAATIIANNPEQFGFSVDNFNNRYTYDEAEVTGTFPLSFLAQIADTTEECLKFLNPELIKTKTPPGIESYTLKVPKGKAELFAERFDALPDSIKSTDLFHIVKIGDDISKICKEYGVNPNLIAAENPSYAKTKKLKMGERIKIPVPEPKGRTMAYSDIAHYGSRASYSIMVPSNSKDMDKFVYQVRKGDVLGSIARDFKVYVSQIKEWNGLRGNMIRNGQKLVIWKKKEK